MDGQAARRQLVQAVLHDVARDVCDERQLTEFHWRLFRNAALPPHLTAEALHDLRGAFLAGAETTFAFLDALAHGDAEDWQPCLRNLREEFARIQDELTLRYGVAAGSA